VEKYNLETPQVSMYPTSTHLNNSHYLLQYLRRRFAKDGRQLVLVASFSALSRARVAPSFANYREWKHTRVTRSNCVTRTDERNRTRSHGGQSCKNTRGRYSIESKRVASSTTTTSSSSCSSSYVFVCVYGSPHAEKMCGPVIIAVIAPGECGRGMFIST